MNKSVETRFIIVFLILTGIGSCKDKLPDTPTVVSGKFIDEAGKPIGNVQLQYYGVDQLGFSARSTFDLTTSTDQDGNYSFSQIAPTGTDHVEILAQQPDSMSAYEYLIYFEVSGKYLPQGSPYRIPKNSWGKSLNLNYQVRRK